MADRTVDGNRSSRGGTAAGRSAPGTRPDEARGDAVPTAQLHDLFGSQWVGDALGGDSGPLGGWSAQQAGLGRAGREVLGFGTVGNAALTDAFSEASHSPAVARRSAAQGRYHLPEAAADGLAMVRRAGVGRPLEDSVRTRMEALFGADLKSVRVHVSGTAAAEVQARAFTVGEHIVFDVAEYQPGSAEGDRLLAHELTHVMQHRRGDRRTRSTDPSDVRGIEDEADRMERRATGMLASVDTSLATEAELPVDTSTFVDVDNRRHVNTGSTPAVGEAAEVTSDSGLSGEVAARTEGDNSELSTLIHRYRRLVRRITNADETLQAFQEAASPENQTAEQADMTALSEQRTVDVTARDEILARITELKGSAYAEAIVARYAGEQEDGGWTFERSVERDFERGGGIESGGEEEEEGAAEEGAAEEEAPASEDAPQEGDPEQAAEGDSQPPSGGGGGAESPDGDTPIPVGNGRGLDTGPDAPQPSGDPGAHVDNIQSGGDRSADGGAGQPAAETGQDAESNTGTPEQAPAEESSGPEGGVPEAGLNPDGEAVHYNLYEGEYADVSLDVAYLDYAGTLEGNLGQIADMPELIMHLREATNVAEVVRVITQFDPSKFQMTGEARAALDAIRATLTVEGAPWPMSIGGQDFLIEWLLALSARAYVEIWATGSVNPDLSNLNLQIAGEAGAALLAEGSAELLTSADWMNDSFGPLMEVGVTGGLSAGASLMVRANLEVGAGVIELSGGYSVTWGVGGRVEGSLRVAVLPTLELIAVLLGVDVANLPEPLDRIYQAFKDNRAMLEAVWDAVEWVREQKPLALVADLLTSEEFWNVIETLILEGTANLSLVQWIRDNYVQIGEEPPSFTICGQQYESYLGWYALSYAEDILVWVEDRGKEVLERVLPLMIEANRRIMQFIVAVGPWIIDLIESAWGFVRSAAELLGERLAPVLEPIGELWIEIWNQLGEPACMWILEKLELGWDWIVEMVQTHGPPFLEWCQGLPAEVQAWFEETVPEVIEALYEGGEYLVRAVQHFGTQLLAYIEEWAPGVVALFSQMTEDLWSAISSAGQEFLEFCVRVGENALQLIGPYAQRVWDFLSSATQAGIEWLAQACRDHIGPALELLDSAGGQLLQDIAGWLESAGSAIGAWLLEHLPAFVAVMEEVGAAIRPYLAALGTQLQAFFAWLVEASGPVRAWLMDAAAWLFARLEANFQLTMDFLVAVGERVVQLWEWGEPYLIQAAELYRDIGLWVLDALMEHGPAAFDWVLEAGAEALRWFTEETRQALENLVEAGEWTVRVLQAIGQPLIPILVDWGGQLSDFGEDIADDLISAYNDYAEPMVRFLLHLGSDAWAALGMALSEVAPIIDRFIREGVDQAVEFASILVQDYGRPALELIADLTEEGFTTVYEWATTDGVALARRIGAHLDDLATAVAAHGEQALIAFIEYGEWVLYVGELGIGPTLEVLEEYGPRYREAFEEYGLPVVRFFGALGQQAVDLAEELGEVLWNAVVEAGEDLYQFASDALDVILPKVVELGNWLWEHLSAFGEELVEVLDWATDQVVRGWQAYGAPAVQFCIEKGQQVLELVQEFGEWVWSTAVAVGDAIYEWAAEWLPIILGKVAEAGRWLLDRIVELGTPVVEFLADLAEDAWALAKDIWQEYGAPAVQFALRLAGDFADFARDVGAVVWDEIVRGADAVYDLYIAYGLPALQAVGDAVISAGRAAWDFAYQHGRAALDFYIEGTQALVQSIVQAGREAWDAAVVLGNEIHALYQQYGAPLVQSLRDAAAEVVHIWNTYGAPVVRRCLDELAAAGAIIWDVVSEVGSAIWEAATAIGADIWAWVRRTAADAWNDLVAGGQILWGFISDVGASILDLVQEYGPLLADFAREATEVIVSALGQGAANLLRTILDGGLVVIEAIGEGGRALIQAIQDVPGTINAIREHGAQFARMVAEHGVAFARMIVNAPSVIFDLCVEYGSRLITLLLRYGDRLIDFVAEYGAAFVDLILRYGTWFIEAVLEYGSVVIDLSLRFGSAFIEALEEFGEWAISWFE